MTQPPEIHDLLAKSGNSFHGRVATWLRNAGWAVRISPYYVDESQSRSREVDLIAEKAIPIKDTFGGPAGSVVARLFIECKFIPQHSVFWMADKDMNHAKEVVHLAGNFDLNNYHCQEHHYLHNDRVAKVYASSQNLETENDPYFKALNQVLNGYVTLKGQSTYFTRSGSPRIRELARVDYPVIVCSSFDKVYLADFFDQGEAIQATDGFQIEINYAYLMNGIRHDTPFLVDFIPYIQLDKLCANITRNAELAGFFAQD